MCIALALRLTPWSGFERRPMIPSTVEESLDSVCAPFPICHCKLKPELLCTASAWWLTAILTALFSILFYWCIERPSHQIADRAERLRCLRLARAPRYASV